MFVSKQLQRKVMAPQLYLRQTTKSTKKLLQIIKFAGTLQYLKDVKKQDARSLGKFTKDNLSTMGATFIKIGQLLSTRTDIISKEFALELSTLQDNVPPFCIDMYKDYLKEVLLDFEEKPIASASIGQVHKARLKTGELVAVKLKRPGIQEEIATDFQMLLGFIDVLRKVSDKRELYELETVFKQYYTLLYEEIDFKREVNNMDAFYKMFDNEENRSWIKIPKNFKDLSTDDIIVMEYLPSIKITNLERLDELKFNKSKIAQKLVECYLIQITEHGKVHIDPHPGNVGITENGKVVFYDYGMVSNINRVLIEKFQDLLFAVNEKDCEKIANVMVEANIVSIEPANMVYLKMFVLSFLNYLDTVDIEYFRENFVDKLNSSQLPFLINSNFLLLLRGLTILEGVCKTLDPKFNYSEVINEFTDRFPFDIQYFEDRALKDIATLQQLRVPQTISKTKKTEIESELMEKQLSELSQAKRQMDNKQQYINMLVIFLMCVSGLEGDLIQHNVFLQFGIACITFLTIYSK
jgi:predicted unusual protein kinase regulating ubiquinone biosynthesis (AarF/ABC1/UbiB family)